MDNSIHNFFNSVLKDYTDFENLKLKTKEWYSKNYKSEMQEKFEYYITKSIRLIYQELLLVKDFKMKF